MLLKYSAMLAFTLLVPLAKIRSKLKKYHVGKMVLSPLTRSFS